MNWVIYIVLALISSQSQEFIELSEIVFAPSEMGWSGGAMVLGKLPVPGRPTIWITVGQGPTALVVGAGGVCLDIFTLIYPFSSLSPSLWETARYRLKYCLKGPLSPKQPTSQIAPSERSAPDSLHFECHPILGEKVEDIFFNSQFPP